MAVNFPDEGSLSDLLVLANGGMFSKEINRISFIFNSDEIYTLEYTDEKTNRFRYFQLLKNLRKNIAYFQATKLDEGIQAFYTDVRLAYSKRTSLEFATIRYDMSKSGSKPVEYLADVRGNTYRKKA